MLNRRDLLLAGSAMMMPGRANARFPRGSAPIAVMPTGALGVWFAGDVVSSPRTIIPNRVGPKLADSNMLMASRRRFSDGNFWSNFFGAVTVTEGVTAPDGSAEASALVATSGSGWRIVSSNDPRQEPLEL